MKTLNDVFFVVLLLCLNGCVSTPTAKLNKRDFLLAKPFTQIDTVIYVSSTGLVDTIMFLPAKVDTVRYRSFEQGFYDQYVLNVRYTLTQGSFHRFAVVDKFHNPERFYNCSVSDISDRELSFLGLIFDNHYLNTLSFDTTTTTFDGEKATYKEVNINNGISSFKFNSKVGVISYIDARGNEWVRIRQ